MCWDYDNEEDECDKDQPGQEDDEGVEVEVGLALRLSLIVRPDHRQHRHALNYDAIRYKISPSKSTAALPMLWEE